LIIRAPMDRSFAQDGTSPQAMAKCLRHGGYVSGRDVRGSMSATPARRSRVTVGVEGEAAQYDSEVNSG
jgi:hypothetical protein